MVREAAVRAAPVPPRRDRRLLGEDIRRVSDDLGNHVERLDQEIQRVASESKALVLDALPQQFLGLIVSGFVLSLAFVAFLLDL